MCYCWSPAGIGSVLVISSCWLCRGSGYKPVPGDIVVWGGGYHNYGHVQVVNTNNGSSLTVVEQNASPSGYDVDNISSSGYISSTG